MISALGYPIGMLLFVGLFFIGMKISNFLDPYPPDMPQDENYKKVEKVQIYIDGKVCNCLKTISATKTYGYNADCDVIEWEFKHFQYELQEPITEILNFISKNYNNLTINDNGNNVECYMTDNLKCFISVNPIKNERIYEYRKPAILRKFTWKKPVEL